jgi:hypothetical protein
MCAERPGAAPVEMLAANLAGDVSQIDAPRGSHAAIQRYAVDGFRAVEEVKGRVHVGAGMDAQFDAAQVRGSLVEYGDAHRTVAWEDRCAGAHRLAKIDDAPWAHPIFVILNDGGSMRKVLHFDSPRESYHCDAAVVWCYDNRFELALRKLLKRTGIAHADAIRVAGGAKCLATPERESEREFVLDQIRKSIRLHGTGRVVLMVHSDCGAYGGLAAFGGDAQSETRHHAGELRRAAECLRQALPEVSVVCYYVDFEGVWIADPESAPN